MYRVGGKRIITFVFLISTVVFSACTGTQHSEMGEENNQVELVVWTWPDNDKAFEKIIPIFEKTNPNIDVNVQAFSSEEYHNKLLSSLVSGDGPDVAMIEINQVANFKNKKGFVDLSQEPFNAIQYKENFPEASWEYVEREDGSVFALPKNTGPGAMFYRRDLFEQAGLPTEPDEVHELLKTWDDYLEIGKKLSKEGEQWMVATPNELYSAITGQAGISNFDKDGNLQIEHPDAKKALEYVDKASKEGLISPHYTMWSPEWGATMQNGTVATYLSGNWLSGSMKDIYAQETAGKWGVTFAPEYQGNSAFNEGGDFIGILETSKQKDAAWEFIKFVTMNMESLEIMYTQNDLYPAWLPALEEDWLNTPDNFFAGQITNDIFGQVSQKLIPQVTNPNDPVVDDAMNSAFINIITGNANYDEALRLAKEEIEAKIE